MDKIQELKKQIDVCQKCMLHSGCKQKVFGDIGKDTRIIFIGEAPGKDEDISGRPFVGRAGQLLRQWIKDANYSDNEISILNVVKCRPPENRTPTEVERQICGEWLDDQIDLLDCRHIVLLGKTACQHFLPDSVFDGFILKHVGKVYEVNGFKYLVFPHPSYVLRNGGHYKVPIDTLISFNLG